MILSSPGFKKYFSNASWLAFERFFRLGLGLFVSVWVARYLGPEAFGEINFAVSLVGLVAAFSSLGLDNVVVKKLIKNTDDVNQIMGTTFVLKLLGAAASFIFIGALLQLPQIKADENIVYILAAMAFFQASNNIDFFFQAIAQNKYVVLVKLIQASFVAISRIVLIYMNADLIWFAWVYLLDALLLALGLFFVYQKYSLFSLSGWQWKQSLAVTLLKSSWPLIMSALVVSVYMKIDQVMLQYYYGLYAVGNYAAASRLSEIPYIIPIVITTALFPAIINAKTISSELYENRMKNLYSMMFVLAMLVILPITFLSDWIILLLYGEAFEESAAVLQVHIWTCIFVFWGVAMGRWVLSEELQKKLFYYQFFGMLTNVVLNAILIPKMGIVGAAWATLFSQITTNLCYPLMFGDKFRMQVKYQIASINFVRPISVLLKKTIAKRKY